MWKKGEKEKEQTENHRKKREEKRKQRDGERESMHHSKNSKALKGIDMNVSFEFRGRINGTEMLRRKEVEVMGLQRYLEVLD